MPALVFRPRQVVSGAPIPDGKTAQQQPGTVFWARATEAVQALLLGGACVVGTVGGPLPPPSQLPGPAERFAAEPPPAELLAGRATALSALPQPPPGQQAGAVVIAREPEPARPFDGRALALRGPAQPLVVQQSGGVELLASPEPPAPDLLAGRATVAQWGVVQPVTQPPPALVAQAVQVHPEAGRTVRSGSRPPVQYLPTALPAFARVEPPPPFPGATVIGARGFGEPRRPQRAVLVRTEDRQPDAGRALLCGPAVAPLTPQQIPGRALLAAAEPPPPFPGWHFVRVRPLVPSDRLRTVPLVARAEEPQPAAGAALAVRVRFDHTPGPRVPLLLDRRDVPPLPGAVVAAPPAKVPLVPQQLAGRALVARAEPAPPFAGAVALWSGRLAGAPRPTLVGARPGGVLQRAGARNRSIKRLPRMSATLDYQTRTKTPTEILAVVFDFTNFPEIVGGATIVSAAVSGPGGSALSGLVAGAPAVLTAAAVIDALGNTVAAGKGVQVALAGGGAGDDVLVECAATLSTGSVAVVQGIIAVRNAR